MTDSPEEEEALAADAKLHLAEELDDIQRRLREHAHAYQGALAREAHDAIAYLRTRLTDEGGEGWVLVPREPTEAMIKSVAYGDLEFSYGGDDSFYYISEDNARAQWSSFLAAAPAFGEEEDLNDVTQSAQTTVVEEEQAGKRSHALHSESP